MPDPSSETDRQAAPGSWQGETEYDSDEESRVWVGVL